MTSRRDVTIIYPDQHIMYLSPLNPIVFTSFLSIYLSIYMLKLVADLPTPVHSYAPSDRASFDLERR